MDFQGIQSLLNVISGYLWGWPMLILLVGTGVWLTILLKGLQFRLLVPALMDALGPQSKIGRGAGEISNRSALLTALAATVGTGNIAGVATAIALGGPGAMFWMWMSGLLGMAIKYGETLLGVHYRIQTADGSFRGGPMYYLTQGAKAPMLGNLFALFLAFAAISIGGMVQSNSIADAMSSGFGLDATLVGGLVVLASAMIMFGGLKRIAQAADLLVPFMILLFAGAGMLVLFANAAYVPAMFESIFRDAFTGTAAVGGFAGSSLMIAMRYGLARGVFANESGLGSAPIVAATAKTKHPAEQALISMTQTFIDTFFVCTFTGLVILVTGAWVSADAQSQGAALTAMAFSTGLGGAEILGYPLGAVIVAISLFFFAFTTILGWGYYGQQGAVYLWGPKVAKPYLVVFLFCTFLGAQALEFAGNARDGVTFIWLIADIATGLMMVPNLFAVLVLSSKIKELTNDYLTARATGRPYTLAPFANFPFAGVATARKAVAKPLIVKKKMVARPAKKAKARRR